MCGFRFLCNTEKEEEREEGRSDSVMRVGKREQLKKKIGSSEPGGMKSNTADWTMTKASGQRGKESTQSQLVVVEVVAGVRFE
jgi:hypothetical protein